MPSQTVLFSKYETGSFPNNEQLALKIAQFLKDGISVRALLFSWQHFNNVRTFVRLWIFFFFFFFQFWTYPCFGFYLLLERLLCDYFLESDLFICAFVSICNRKMESVISSTAFHWSNGKTVALLVSRSFCTSFRISKWKINVWKVRVCVLHWFGWIMRSSKRSDEGNQLCCTLIKNFHLMLDYWIMCVNKAILVVNRKRNNDLCAGAVSNASPNWAAHHQLGAFGATLRRAFDSERLRADKHKLVSFRNHASRDLQQVSARNKIRHNTNIPTDILRTNKYRLVQV